jgi:hypothetical protein
MCVFVLAASDVEWIFVTDSADDPAVPVIKVCELCHQITDSHHTQRNSRVQYFICNRGHWELLQRQGPTCRAHVCPEEPHLWNVDRPVQ